MFKLISDQERFWFRLDSNLDGSFTISDLPTLLHQLFFLPGDLVYCMQYLSIFLVKISMDFIKGISRILLVLWALYNLMILFILKLAFNEAGSFTFSDFKEFFTVILAFNIIPALIYFPVMWILKGFKKNKNKN